MDLYNYICALPNEGSSDGRVLIDNMTFVTDLRLPGPEVRSYEFRGCSFQGTYEQWKFRECTFVDCAFDNANFVRAVFGACKFDGGYCINTDFKDARFRGGALDRFALSDAKVTGVKMLKVNFVDVEISEEQLTKAHVDPTEGLTVVGVPTSEMPTDLITIPNDKVAMLRARWQLRMMVARDVCGLGFLALGTGALLGVLSLGSVNPTAVLLFGALLCIEIDRLGALVAFIKGAGTT